MGCSCRGNKSKVKYVWTDGETTMEYKTEIEAKAKVMRKGGSYKPVPV